MTKPKNSNFVVNATDIKAHQDLYVLSNVQPLLTVSSKPVEGLVSRLNQALPFEIDLKTCTKILRVRSIRERVVPLPFFSPLGNLPSQIVGYALKGNGLEVDMSNYKLDQVPESNVRGIHFSVSYEGPQTLLERRFFRKFRTILEEYYSP